VTTQTVSSEPPAQPEGRRWLRDRPDRRLIIALVALVLALVVSITGWRAWTAHALGGVEVNLVSGANCAGTKLRPDGRTIVAQPGMSCVYKVSVRNSGPVTIHIDRAVLPLLGTEGGATVMAAAVDGYEPAEGEANVDAEIVLDRDLDSGDSVTFRVRVVFRPDGCMAAGSRMWVDDWPTVEADYLGRDVASKGNTQFSVYSERQNPGCTY
jgi:hypothetical protein